MSWEKINRRKEPWDVVRGKVVGKDESELKSKDADKIAAHMSWQLHEQMKETNELIENTYKDEPVDAVFGEDANDKYSSLREIFMLAAWQAEHGKGMERHACGERFENQQICEMARRLGVAGPLYQAAKKIYESQRLGGSAGIHELYGAMVYIAAAVIVMREQQNNTDVRVG